MLKWRNFVYDADKGGAEGGGQADQGQGQPDDTPTGGGEQPGFTQDDLNRYAGRARAEGRAAVLNDLGFESLDDLQAAVESHRQAQEAARTDLERAQEQAQKFQEQAQQARQQMREMLLRTRFQLAAADQVADLDLAYLAAQQAGLLAEDIEIDLEAGQVSGLETAIETLLKQRPILRKQQQPAQAAGTDGGQTNNGRAGIDKDALAARFGI
jgi:hypothetical protein